MIVQMENRHKDFLRCTINVEVQIKAASAISETALDEFLRQCLKNYLPKVPVNDSLDVLLCSLELRLLEYDSLNAHIGNLSIEAADGRETLKISELMNAEWKLFFYKFIDEKSTQETDNDTVTYTQQILPCREFQSLWNSLIYDHDIKTDLLNYAEDAILFSTANVDPNLVTWNKVVLLHGPPGTGKTSLCRALCNKLSIRLGEHYQCVYMIEINSHSLFSRWFSESGKLVMKMFETVESVVSLGDSLVCLLIDEVESLARARDAAASGSEPSDAMRAVNALLTQLDRIKRHPNVLVLTTSNISHTIDLAFVDRADIKKYIGQPSYAAIVTIYKSSLKELQAKGIVDSKEMLDEQILSQLAKASSGLSGRSLRRIPFLAHAIHFSGKLNISLLAFVEKMLLTVEKQHLDSKLIQPR